MVEETEKISNKSRTERKGLEIEGQRKKEDKERKRRMIYEGVEIKL